MSVEHSVNTKKTIDTNVKKKSVKGKTNKRSSLNSMALINSAKRRKVLNQITDEPSHIRNASDKTSYSLDSGKQKLKHKVHKRQSLGELKNENNKKLSNKSVDSRFDISNNSSKNRETNPFTTVTELLEQLDEDVRKERELFYISKEVWFKYQQISISIKHDISSLASTSLKKNEKAFSSMDAVDNLNRVTKQLFD